MAAVPTEVRLTIKLVEWTAPIEGWDVSELLGGGLVTASWTGTYELRQMTAIYTRQPTGGPPQDAAMTTHHFINLTGGTPDPTWTSADYSQVETAFTAFWTSIKPDYSPAVKLLEVRWYKAGPAFKPFGSTAAPLERLTSINAPGTSSVLAELPPQCAVTVTEVTTAHYNVPPEHGHPGQLRHRWGRFYLPAPTFNVMGAIGSAQEGRMASARQTAWAAAAKTFYNACRGGNNLVPVMYSPTTGSAWSVDSIHLDDIIDIQRRRRFDTPLSRADSGDLDPVTGG